MSISKKFRRTVRRQRLTWQRTMLYRSDMDEKLWSESGGLGSCAGLSQNDLAVQVGTTNMSISRLERGVPLGHARFAAASYRRRNRDEPGLDRDGAGRMGR